MSSPHPSSPHPPSSNPPQGAPAGYSDPASRSMAASPGPATQTIIVRPNGTGGVMWRIFAFFGWLGFGFVAILALGQYVAFLDYFDNSQGITEKYHSGERFASDKIAIISVEGVIANPEGYVEAQIRRVREDENVKAVVVRVNSPGGTVTGSDYIFHRLTQLREQRKFPLIVSMGGIAASGGYYVAMAVGDQAQSIYAEPTTTTGSIGVMFPHYDLSGLLARFDVKDDSVVTHSRKEIGSMTKPMSSEHRELIEAYIHESFLRFKEVIQKGRPHFRQDPSALDRLATGEIFTANQAKKHGLIDEIGFLEDAVEKAVARAGLSKDKVRVVEFEQPVSLFSIGGLALTSNNQTASRQGRAMWELATPQGYYLATMLPPSLSTYFPAFMQH